MLPFHLENARQTDKFGENKKKREYEEYIFIDQATDQIANSHPNKDILTWQ